eukprot:6040951-Pleurochrysis_carterae.AAC.1
MSLLDVCPGGRAAPHPPSPAFLVLLPSLFFCAFADRHWLGGDCLSRSPPPDRPLVRNQDFPQERAAERAAGRAPLPLRRARAEGATPPDRAAEGRPDAGVVHILRLLGPGVRAHLCSRLPPAHLRASRALHQDIYHCA